MLNESKEVWKSKILNKLYRYYIQIQGDIEKGIYKSNNYAQNSEYQYLLKQLR